MNVKIRIALNGIAQKVSRGIFNAEQAASHFKKVTGEDLAEFIRQADPEVGEFLAYLGGAYPIPTAQIADADLEESPATFSAPLVSQELTARGQAMREAIAELAAIVNLPTPTNQENEAGPIQAIETDLETPTGQLTESTPQEPKNDAPVAAVDQPKRTRQTGESKPKE